MYQLPPPDAPRDRATHFANWDRGDGNADEFWCVLCLEHRTWRTIADPLATYFCPVCIDERTAA
jgi:hypothetical protein